MENDDDKRERLLSPQSGSECVCVWSYYIQLLGQSFVVLQVLPELDVLALISCKLGLGIIKLRFDGSTILARHVIPSLCRHQHKC